MPAGNYEPGTSRVRKNVIRNIIQMNPLTMGEGVSKVREEKLRTLEKAFEPIIRKLIIKVRDPNNDIGFEEVTAYGESVSKQLVYEVKIRINNK